MRSFNAAEIAKEIVDTLARHKVSANALEIIFEAVQEEVKKQFIMEVAPAKGYKDFSGQTAELDCYKLEGGTLKRVGTQNVTFSIDGKNIEKISLLVPD